MPVGAWISLASLTLILSALLLWGKLGGDDTVNIFKRKIRYRVEEITSSIQKLEPGMYLFLYQDHTLSMEEVRHLGEVLKREADITLICVAVPDPSTSVKLLKLEPNKVEEVTTCP